MRPPSRFYALPPIFHEPFAATGVLTPAHRMIDVTLLSVFLVGLLGGLHCAGMCGGIVAVMGATAGGSAKPADGAPGPTRPADPPRPGDAASSAARRLAAIGVRVQPLARPARLVLGYNLGRITSYAVAGALAGAIGSSATLVRQVLPVQQAGFIAANLLLIAMGLSLTGAWRGLSVLEGAGAGLWRRLQPLAARSLAADSVARAWRAGLVWGWVPCGMVYGVLMAALLSGSALRGAALLLAFGAGTLPALLALGGSAAIARRWLTSPRLRVAAGVLITAFGVAGLARLDPLVHLHRVVDACLTLF
jgi:sulfite exporter TauE/SafE